MREALQVGVALEDLLQQAQAAAAGADTELRVQRQHHQLVDAVPLDLRRRNNGKGFNVWSKPYSGGTTSFFTPSRLICGGSDGQRAPGEAE